MTTTPYHDIAGICVGTYNREESARLAEHLTFIEDIDLDEEAYSYDILRLFVRKGDGVVLYATDSGCSCPSPFEDTPVSDLKETTLARVEDVARGLCSTYGRHVSAVLADVRSAIPAMREAGAK